MGDAVSSLRKKSYRIYAPTLLEGWVFSTVSEETG